MHCRENAIIVGVLGQWASGKSTAAKILVEELGGQDEVTFLIDLEPFAGRALSHVLEPGANVVRTAQEDGTERLEGESATVWLPAGANIEDLDLTKLQFDMSEEMLPVWLYEAKLDLGQQICERAPEGKPLVVEAAFGRHPVRNTVVDLLSALEEAGVENSAIRWIIVEAGFDRRAERNRQRSHGVPVDAFARYAADGGGLAPERQRELEERGYAIERVWNDHDDLARFRADVIAALARLVGDQRV